VASTAPATQALRVNHDSPDIASLVAGIAVVALGILLLLDATGAVELEFAVLAPVACAATGAILLARGLTRSG
jgi:hypothetical protein